MVATPRTARDGVAAIANQIQDLQRQLDALTRRLGGTGLPDATTPMIVNTLATSAPAMAVYQSANTGITKAQVQLAWTPPANDDGTTITDGSHFQIRYRTINITTTSTWGDLASHTWGDLAAGTWGNPLNQKVGDPPQGGVAPPGTNDGVWHYLQTDFDSVDFLVKELTPGVTYDFQIRAVDTSGNAGPWSEVQTATTPGDVTPPSTPAPPTVAGSRIAVQVTHTLGKAGGGTFNLEPDLHHLEVHAQYEPLFTPSDATRLGKVLANSGMMLAGIPLIQTFPIESTAPVYVKVIAVDEAGNKSAPSQAVGVTAALIDNAHISDLAVDKVTAGTINAQWLLSGSIKTANSGARMESDASGLRLYDNTGTNTVNLSAQDGSATMTGTMQSVFAGRRVVMGNLAVSGGTVPGIDLYDDASPDHFRLLSYGGAFYLRRETSGYAVDGGEIYFDNSQAAYGFHRGSLNPSINFHWDETIGYVGKFADNIGAQGPTDAIFTGSVDVANTSSSSFSYGPTMASEMNPVCTLFNSGGVLANAVTAASTTGFTFAWGSSASVRCIFWVFRT